MARLGASSVAGGGECCADAGHARCEGYPLPWAASPPCCVSRPKAPPLFALLAAMLTWWAPACGEGCDSRHQLALSVLWAARSGQVEHALGREVGRRLDARSLGTGMLTGDLPGSPEVQHRTPPTSISLRCACAPVIMCASAHRCKRVRLCRACCCNLPGPPGPLTLPLLLGLLRVPALLGLLR